MLAVLTLEEGRRDPAALVAELREHLHSLARLRDALGSGSCSASRSAARTSTAGIYRLASASLEEELIGKGGLSAAGARLVGRRRDE